MMRTSAYGWGCFLGWISPGILAGEVHVSGHLFSLCPVAIDQILIRAERVDMRPAKVPYTSLLFFVARANQIGVSFIRLENRALVILG